MKKFTFSILFGLISLCGFSQIGLTENFDGGLALPAGWTSDAGDYFGAVVQVCDGFSQRVNLFDANTTAHLTSPNIVGSSNGSDLTITFDYKIVDWSAAVDATPPGWGELYVQYSTNNGGVWNTIETINDDNHITSSDCFNFSTVVPAANLPAGSDFKLRFDATWLEGTYYIYIDNVTATQVVVDPPSCVNLITPANGSNGVGINTNLEWSAATGIPTGYTLSVGTAPGATDIVDNEDVGLSTSYTFGAPLEYSTTYYVSVLGYNANGPAEECEEFSFTTGADPNAPVDCEAGTPINTVYCYGNNETQTWNFQSSDGGPLNVFFNAGQMEGCCDEVTIYDGTDNTGTVLYDDNNGGDMTGVSVNSTTGFIFIEIDSDGSVSCEANGYVPLNFDVSCIDTTAVPNCNSVLTTPANGAVDVDNNTDITWSAASVIVTGYTISIGTTPGGTDVLDNFDNGPATTYDPGTLDYETDYYVTIVPYNDNGPAENCNEQSFTVMDDPNQILDCTSGEEINTTYCYGQNDTMTFNYASNDGSPLSVVFNSGWIEAGWDELIVTDSDGTIIYQDDNGGDLTGLVFVSSGSSIAISIDSDGSVSCESTGNAQWDFTVSCVDTTALPNCNASLTGAVANGSGDVDENEDLTWSPATVFVTGYVINMGTTPGGTDVLDGVDVGNVLTYDPGTLEFETTYFVTIIPYNENGSAEDCTEESFTVEDDPNQIVDCASGEVVNTTFCYENNSGGAGANVWVDVFSFQSSDGSPLAISFNSGNMENGFDTIRITDSDGSIIFEGQGELSGLSFFTTGDSLTVWYESDGSVSCSSGSRPEWDFDVACFDPTAVPNCNATVTAPAAGEIDVNIDADLTWTPASIVVTGYIINMGTTPGGTDVLDGVDVGDVLTYDPGTLENATQYYVTVIPYNDNGQADTDCIESTFRTICIPQVVSFNAVGDCETDPDNPEFVLEVNIEDLSGAESITILDDQGSPVQTADAPGVVTMGPYAANTVVTITTIKSDDKTCDVISSPITFICPPPPNPCSIVYAGEDAAVDCDENTSTDLTAVYHLFGQNTNNYTINELSACPLPTTVGGTPTSLDIDDRWSEVIDIGFEFCFFDEVYDQILIGSNGVLSFELENAGNFNGWNIDPGDTLPNNDNATLTQANIFGVAHDIDPSVSGDINYLVIGSAPYRMFVVNYVDVAHFSSACNQSLFSSSQIILYESSNNIDINVFEKPICSGWNDGNAVIGVQNIDDTVAFTPAGRNTGVWEVTPDAPESYRFAPYEDTPSFVFEWFEGTTSLGNSETITVSPTETTTYTATVTYDLCTGGTATVVDEVTVTVSGSGGEASFTIEPSCDGATATITGDEGGTFSFDPEPSDDAEINEDTGEITNGTPGETYTVVYSISGECGSTATESVTLLPAEDASFTLEATCDGATATINGDTGGTFAFNPEPGDGAEIDSETGEITNGTSGTTYTVEYTTSGDCASSSTQDVTVLDEEDASFTLEATCDGAVATITGTIGGSFAFNPEPGDGAEIDSETGEITNGFSGTTYTVEYTTSGDCASSSTQDVTVLDAEDASFTLEATCDGATATITGDIGGTFAFNPEPGDGAVLGSDGTITNGISGATYTVEYTTSGDCPASSTQDVTVLDAEDASFSLEATCDGATATIIGDAGGIFTFNPEPGDGAEVDPNGNITGGTPGATYTVEYTTTGPCPASSTESVTVLPAEDASFTLEATCDGATATITGDIGGTFTFNPEPDDGAVIDSNGNISGGTPGATYTVEYTTSGPCPASSTQSVTVLPAEDASFTLEATCDGATATILGDIGGAFTFNPEPGDGAVLGSDGTITNGTPGATYTVEYTTSGPCPASSIQSVTVLPAEDASFTLDSICNEATATITGDMGGTFAFNPEPGDGAQIDSETGAITNGTLGNSYTVEYTTSGPCPASSTQTITLEDNVPPVAIAQDITVQLDEFGNASISVEDINNGSSDDCGIDTMTIDIDSFTCENVGENTVTLTVTDVGGNVSTATATVTVEDNVMPEVVCNDITVSLDSTGNYMLSSEDIDAIAAGSSDACGIESMTVSPQAFTCDEIGDNTVTLIVVDVNGNENSCEATVTVEGVIPTVSITEEPLPVFCTGVILTAESDVTVTYEWTTGEDTQSITVVENGIYGVTVTSETNCTAYIEYEVTSIPEGEAISNYAILARDRVFLHGDNLVETGKVGSTYDQIKLHQNSHIVESAQANSLVLNQGSTVGDAIYESANPYTPPFLYNTMSNNGSPSVEVGTGQTMVLDGDVYDWIKVRQGATVTFSQTNVFINRLQTWDGASIEFEGCANVYINDRFMLAQNGTINSEGNNVVMYVDNDVHVQKGSSVTAIIYANGEIKAHGNNENSSNPEPTYMTGLFIAESVHGINNVIWNAGDICSDQQPCPAYITDEEEGPMNREAQFDVVAWPNPSNTTFDMMLRSQDVNNDAVVYVYDMSNKLVHTATFSPDKKYTFGSELEGGVYIVKVKQAKNSKVIRLIKY